MLQLKEIIWKSQFVEKLEQKHQISTQEAEYILFTKPFIRRLEKGL